MDSSVPGIDVHHINVLTFIASESYEQFAKQLQNDIAKTFSDRPCKADRDFFLNKVLKNARSEQLKLENALASKLLYTFIKNDYVDEQHHLTNVYFNVVENQSLKPPEELTNF